MPSARRRKAPRDARLSFNGKEEAIFSWGGAAQARVPQLLWLRHIPGTRLLNDNPVVRIADGVPTVYGLLSGKTPCYRNERSDRGDVQINQAPENRIRRMSVPEAVASLFASCSGLKSIRSIGDGLFATIAP